MSVCNTCNHEYSVHRIGHSVLRDHCGDCCGLVEDGDYRDCLHTFSALVRPTWDEYFLEIARTVATRASCPRASVGAVIVSRDNRILATGYNGAPPNEEHCLEGGCIIEDNHCQRVLHAEVNAIAHAARAGVSIEGARIYVSGLPPCRECMKVIKAAGLEVAAYAG